MAHAVATHDPSVNYLNEDKGIWSWLTTVDHKRIGVMYLVSVLIAFLLGGTFALLVRLSLLNPKHMLFGKVIMTAETYNQVFTLHGAVMVFLFIIPSIPAALGNILHPPHAGRQGRGVPPHEPDELLLLSGRRLPGAGIDRVRRHRHRLDVLHALLDVHRRRGGHDDDGGLRSRASRPSSPA